MQLDMMLNFSEKKRMEQAFMLARRDEKTVNSDVSDAEKMQAYALAVFKDLPQTDEFSERIKQVKFPKPDESRLHLYVGAVRKLMGHLTPNEIISAIDGLEPWQAWLIHNHLDKGLKPEHLHRWNQYNNVSVFNFNLFHLIDNKINSGMHPELALLLFSSIEMASYEKISRASLLQPTPQLHAIIEALDKIKLTTADNMLTN